MPMCKAAQSLAAPLCKPYDAAVRQLSGDSRKWMLVVDRQKAGTNPRPAGMGFLQLSSYPNAGEPRWVVALLAEGHGAMRENRADCTVLSLLKEQKSCDFARPQ